MKKVGERGLTGGLQKFLRVFGREQIWHVRVMGKEMKGGILNIAVVSGYIPSPTHDAREFQQPLSVVM